MPTWDIETLDGALMGSSFGASWRPIGHQSAFDMVGGYFAGVPYWSMIYFALPDEIPAGSTIQSAALDLYGYTSVDVQTGDYLRVYVQDQADCTGNVAAGANWASTITLYPASLDAGVRWPTVGTITWPEQDRVQSPDLATLIQHLVDTYDGLAAGALIGVFFTKPEASPVGQTDLYCVWVHPGAGAIYQPTALSITWEAPTPPTPIENSDDTSILRLIYQ